MDNLQINWALKTITYRKKHESSRELKLNFEILPRTQFLKYKRTSTSISEILAVIYQHLGNISTQTLN